MVIEGDKDEWEVSLLKNHWLLSSLCICCSFVPGTSRAGQGRADMDTGQVWIQGKYGYRTGMDTGQVWIMDQEAGQWHLLGCYGDQVKVRQEKTSRGLVGLYSKSRISGRMQSQESSWSTLHVLCHELIPGTNPLRQINALWPYSIHGIHTRTIQCSCLYLICIFYQ